MFRYFSYCFIVLLVLLGSVRCRKVYVLPSTGCSVCPSSTDSCMTLSQIAASTRVALPTGPNLTIIFLPGNHTLNTTNFSLATIPRISMKSQSRDGPSRYLINCYNSSRFQFRFNTLVHISGLTFKECYETEIHQVKKFVMEDCWLSGTGRPLGRSLVVTQSTLNVRRTNFMLFCGSVTHKGGAVYCSQSNVSLSDCMFTKNGATSGAAAYIEENSILISLNCSFSNHVTYVDKETDNVHGIVYANVSSVILLESSFNNNCFCHGNITAKYNGGVLGALKSNVSVSECAFIGNVAFNGGVAFCHRGAKLMISSTIFAQNKATNYGGVIYQLDCDVHITGSNFSHNTGKLGGVLYHTTEQSVDTLVIEGSNFHKNSADRGGIMYFFNGTTEINGSLFSFNMASEQGGSLFFTFSNATIINSRFENNRAVTLGGALRAMNDSQVYILGSALFENNSAFYGAAVQGLNLMVQSLSLTIRAVLE